VEKVEAPEQVKEAAQGELVRVVESINAHERHLNKDRHDDGDSIPDVKLQTKPHPVPGSLGFITFFPPCFSPRRVANKPIVLQHFYPII
jgi:hypothetical protein